MSSGVEPHVRVPENSGRSWARSLFVKGSLIVGIDATTNEADDIAVSIPSVLIWVAGGRALERRLCCRRMALSNSEKQLAGLAASLPRTDPVLQTLLRVTDLHQFSVGLSITVLVDGYLIRGNLMGSPRYAAQLEAGLDAGIRELIERVGADEPASITAEAWRAGIVGKFSEQARESDEAEERHFEAIQAIAAEKGVSTDDIGIDDLPNDVGFAEIFRTASRSVLTLENAVLLVPPLFREDQIGVARVHTSQIAAWWTRTEPAEPPGKESD